MSYVLLEDGTRFDGDPCGAPGRSIGEVVFNTAMSGYQEAITDPSYARPADHLHLSAHRQLRRARRRDGVRPHPCARRDHARRRATAARPSAEGGWLDWLEQNAVAAITGVDTRALVRHIREPGSMRGGIFPSELASRCRRAR